jgi:hypothetical protein
MNEINTNSRLLRASEAGFHMQGGSVVCNGCGIRDLCARKKERTVCQDFSPILTFRPPLIGLDGWSNTFRLSALWYDRLKGRIGHTLTYYDARKPIPGRNPILGRARLTGIARGTLKEMVERYAWSNHLSLGKGVSREDAPEFLRGVLNKNYKTMFKKGGDDDIVTVIFSVRLRDTHSAEDVEGLLGRKAA